jgi:Asp-tRNA(Asn)/Glu-tRNA(Gln) amidotransferase A subunit family amidase
LRTSPKLPDLALTTRVYAEQLFAFYGANLPVEAREAVTEAARSLPPDDQSFAAARLRRLAISHPDRGRTGFIRSGLRARWQALFQDVDVLICPPMPTPAFPHDHSPVPNPPARHRRQESALPRPGRVVTQFEIRVALFGRQRGAPYGPQLAERAPDYLGCCGHFKCRHTECYGEVRPSCPGAEYAGCGEQHGDVPNHIVS